MTSQDTRDYTFILERKRGEEGTKESSISMNAALDLDTGEASDPLVTGTKMERNPKNRDSLQTAHGFPRTDG